MVASPLFQKAYGWLSDRIGLSAFQAIAREKTVPVHSQAFWYYMGGTLLFLIGVQVVTGALLLVYYIPSIREAHSSILRLNTHIEFGWFVRSMHHWGANLAIVALVLHFTSTYLMKAYRPPREITWLTGLALGGLMLAFAFTGYLLPWDELSLFATKVGIQMTELVPLIGKPLANLLRGGAFVSDDTLSRFFTLHVIVLPLLLAGVLGVHLFLVTWHGNAAPAFYNRLPESERQSESFFPSFLLKDITGWVLVLNLLAFLVTMIPQGTGTPANPFAATPPGIKPEWYFLSMYQFLKLLPSHVGPFAGEKVGLLLITLIMFGVVLAPFFDTGRSALRGRIATWYGVFLLIGLVVLTVWGHLS